MAEEDQIIETVDENGNVVKFELFDIVEVDDEPASGVESARMEEIIKNTEAGRLEKYISSDSYVIALAIEGKKLDSIRFSEKIKELGIAGKSNLTFIIGGSLGLDAALLKRADMLLSFSDMTFPHQLMRVILLEQIYRAFRIIRHEPYHK